AVTVVSDEPALRRMALVALHVGAGRVRVDGKRLVAPGRQRGEVLEIDVVVPVLPLAQSSGLDAALAPLGRATRYVGAALASDAAGAIALPARVLLGTDAVRAEMLTSALQEAIARRLPAGGGTVTALMPAVVGGIASETPLDVADLAAIAAACV